MKNFSPQPLFFSLTDKYHNNSKSLISRSIYFLLTAFLLLSNCGTIYIPQILPEARGVGKSIGQEDISVQIIPVTNESIKVANRQPYIRRVIDASDLNQPAQLVSVEDAIGEILPPDVNKTPYRLGISDELQITQLLNVQDETGSTKKSVASRTIKIADDGFVAVLGIGRLQLAGLTQFEAEDLIYQTLVRNEINPEFELQISKFESKKIYLTAFSSNTMIGTNLDDASGAKFISLPFTNTDIYLHQLLIKLKPETKTGQDSLIILKRGNNIFRMSLKKVLTGELQDIRILAEDRLFIESLPYRPETAILTGEVKEEKLIELSASRRQSLAEALYSQGGAVVRGQSDTSQMFVIREIPKKKIIAYHLDSSNPARLTLAAKFELRPNDIIYLAPQFVTNYNRALIQIFSAYAITTDPPLAAR